MKIEYSLLTLLSASLVAAAPAPFVVTNPVLAGGADSVTVPVTDLERRQQVSVYGFRKRNIKLRSALLAARGGRQASEDNAEGVQAAQEDAALAAPGNGKGKGKGKGNNANQDGAAAIQEYALLGDAEQAGGNAAGTSLH